MSWFDEIRDLIPFLRKKGGATSKKAIQGPDLKPLKQPLTVPVERQGQRKQMKFELTEMAVNAFVFQTTSPVVEREMLILELTLPGLGRQTVTGTVEWVLSSGSTFTGQLNTWPSPEQKQALAQMLRQLQRY
jgi:hypothetical protein